MQTPRGRSTLGQAVPGLADAGVGVAVAVGLLVAGRAGVGPRWVVGQGRLDGVAVGLVGVVAAALAVRRRYPVVVLVVVNAAALAWAAGGHPGRLILLAPLLACYTLAAARGWRWGLVGVVATAVSALVAIRVGVGVPAGAAGSVVWMAATAGAGGTAVGYYRALLVATRAELARQAQTREEQARRLAVEERLRIARELHDVFGHTMATISVQAGVGVHLLATRPAQAAAALATIKQISDQGLADVTAILGVLRADPDQPRSPPGGLGGLQGLLDPLGAAGVQPRLSVDGSPRPLPAAVELAAYRIIQEALTNVLRHAHARTVWLRVGYQPAWLVIQVRNDGPPASPPGLVGHGISGMRERALALGGVLAAGPHPEGGFLVRAALPTRQDGGVGPPVPTPGGGGRPPPPASGGGG